MKRAFCTALFGLAFLAACSPKQISAPPPSNHDQIRLTATVKEVVWLSEFSGQAIRVHFDPMFAMTVVVRAVEPPLERLKPGEVVTFAIHSRSQLFHGEVPIDQTCEFVLFAKREQEKVRFDHLELRLRANSGRYEPPCD